MEKKEKPGKIVLLNDNENDVLMTFDMNVSDERKNMFKKLAKDERMINYNNLLFKTGNPSISNFDFLKRLGTLFDLLTDLLNEKISIDEAKQNKKR